MKKQRKQLFALMISALFTIMGISYPLTVNAKEPEAGNGVSQKEWNWTYGYTGTEQVFRAPYSGIYLFELYGAQGGRTDSNEGGKGGKITAAVALSRNEEIVIYVGGTDGYNGGAAGTISNGGGATDIRRDGNEPENRILVAGGGGGANNIYPGGNGGTDIAGTSSGAGEPSTEGSGGGGGYQGGSAGIEHIVAHVHTAYGGSCYAPDYHTHTGDESAYGGCYTTPKQRTESVTEDHIWIRGHETDSGTHTGPEVEGELESHYHWKEYLCTDQHGHTATLRYVYWANEDSARHNAGTWRLRGSADYTDNGKDIEYDQSRYGTDWSRLWDTLSTQKTTQSTVTYYDLGCGLEAGAISGYHMDCSVDYDEYKVNHAAGGTNYFDAGICTAISEAGVQIGNGACSIKLLTLYNLYYCGIESLNVYYDGIKVKNVYYMENLIYKE